ncbi:hypothetical protein [Neolewinella persica]|uniref:hypothetical protein n=1 Tax=Neolewinella persica TaxID=70998 RepID=UPI000370BA5A|nr:hypothetical protein [Neolewinella persica]
MSLLQQIIHNLSVAEAKRAELWLEAALHNRREDVRILFRLRRQYLTEGIATPSPSDEFAMIYPGEPDEPAKFRQLEHQLLKRLEAFLAWDTFNRDEFGPDEYLLRAYRARRLDDHRRTRIRRYRPTPLLSTERLHLEYRLAMEKYDLDIAASRGGRVDYLAPETTLERYLLALRLRQACLTLAHQRLHKTANSYEIPRLELLLQAASRAPYNKDPYISLFLLVARLQLNADIPPDKAESSFTQLTAQLSAISEYLSPEDQRNLMLLAINYGVRRANSGTESFISATFTLYKLALSLGFLYDRGRLTIFTFNNILALAIRLKQVDYAASFLDEYQHQLPEKGGSEVLALGRARLALATGQDGDALFHLQQADFKDFIHHLTARVMQLKIYFRQDNYGLLQSHISSTRKLLTRRKRIGYHLQNYRNIFQFANAIIRLAPGDNKAKQLLIKRIEQTDPCTERPWLLEQLK